MFYKNARIFTTDFRFQTGAFEVTADGRFGKILPQEVPADAIDLQGATVIPGLIDVHIHGAAGADSSDGDLSGLQTMARFLASAGVTAYAPTTATLPYEVLGKAFITARELAENRPDDCARVIGCHMEGPFFSYSKRGAQNPAYLKDPDYAGFEKLYNECGGMICIADVAPELPGAEDFISKASKLCTISIAHTDSDYDHAKAGFSAGATHLTHLYNAMSPISHRDPGVIPAAVENQNVRTELICDGLHSHPAMVRLAFSMFGPERIVLVSDALRCCGLPDGEYEMGGQQVYLKGGIARLASGTIAGAATNLYDGMRNAIAFGIPEADAVRTATYNPACAAGAADKLGSICEGKLADFLVCSADYTTKRVFIGGKELH